MNTPAKAALDLIAALGYEEPANVAEVVITPFELTVRRFAVDENGRKYIDPSTSEVAQCSDVHPIDWSKESVA